LSRPRSVWKRFWRFVDRWEWLIWALLAIGAVGRGDAVGAALFGALFGLEYQSRQKQTEVHVYLDGKLKRRRVRPTEEAP
jgi:hypothetical protein